MNAKEWLASRKRARVAVDAPARPTPSPASPDVLFARLKALAAECEALRAASTTRPARVSAGAGFQPTKFVRDRQESPRTGLRCSSCRSRDVRRAEVAPYLELGRCGVCFGWVAYDSKGTLIYWFKGEKRKETE